MIRTGDSLKRSFGCNILNFELFMLRLFNVSISFYLSFCHTVYEWVDEYLSDFRWKLDCCITMKNSRVPFSEKYVLLDIEGTTTSIKFVKVKYIGLIILVKLHPCVY